MRLVLALVLAACGHGNQIETCGSDLGGVWHVPGGMTWFVLDHGVTLEGYPMTPDAQGPARGPSATETRASAQTPTRDRSDSASGPRDVVTAPRVVDLTRDEAGTIAGQTRRRFMRRADSCEGHVVTRVTKCHAGTLEVVTADIVAPLGFAPCTWPAAEPARVERWQRD